MARSDSQSPLRVITLDGLAGSGKSTLARRLAERLGWAYLDSGAWYRALTWAVLRDGADPGSADEVHDTLSQIDIHAHPDGTVVVDGAPLRSELRTERIDARVPDVADHPRVRAALVERMRDLRRRQEVRGIVADGRDAGTVIFPDAGLKVYVDTEIEARAARR
ncbi:MAG TPA: (d)CMP kinase, partial [Planctomycetota bacterium]